MICWEERKHSGRLSSSAEVVVAVLSLKRRLPGFSSETVETFQWILILLDNLWLITSLTGLFGRESAIFHDNECCYFLPLSSHAFCCPSCPSKQECLPLPAQSTQVETITLDSTAGVKGKN